MKKLFILGGGEMQVPIIKRAKDLGIFCIVSDFNPDAPGFAYADVSLNISTLDFDKTLELAKLHSVDGILTTSDYPVRTVASVCEVLKLKGLSVYSAEICTNKFMQRKAMMASAEYYVPKHFLFSSVDEINISINNLAFPLIVKPIDSSASRGVSMVESTSELLKTFEVAMEYSLNKKVIVEEFVDGNEYSIESLTQNGTTHIIAITQKEVIGSENGFFVESKHVVPANITSKEEEELHKFVKDVIRILKIDNSATHTEVKLSSKGPVLIEIGARLGGDYITSDLVPLAIGVDMLENVIRIALNERINLTCDKSLFAGVRFVNSDNYNSVKGVIAQESEFIIRYELKEYKKILMTNSLDRLGYIIACSRSREELDRVLDL